MGQQLAFNDSRPFLYAERIAKDYTFIEDEKEKQVSYRE